MGIEMEYFVHCNFKNISKVTKSKLVKNSDNASVKLWRK